MVTNEEIHAIVRLRGHGLKEKDPAVRGYELQSDEDGFSYREDEAAFRQGRKGIRWLREGSYQRLHSGNLRQIFWDKAFE